MIMGQAISRRVVPRLNAALKKYENAATKDAIADMAKRQSLAKSGKTGGYSDPNAVHGGFRRENAPGPQLPQEAAQEQFLRKEHGDSPTEMPDDLLKFLNDNPLEKKVDKDLTSPKVYDALVEGGEGQQEQQQKKRTPRTRTRRTMPLAESMIEDLPDDVSSDIVGATGVQRTTNFSTAQTDDEEDDLDRLLRMTDKELSSLLRQYGATDGMNVNASDANVDGSVEEAKKKKEKDAEEYFANNTTLPSDLTDERRAAHTSLVANALMYSGMPLLMKDVDSDYVGVWSGRVRDMERMKLRVVEDEETTIVFEKIAGSEPAAVDAEEGSGDNIAAKEASVDAWATATPPDDEFKLSKTSDSAVASKPASRAETKEEKEQSSSDEDLKDGVMEEQKKVKGRIGSSGPASRRFLEEEAARAAAAATTNSKDKIS